MGLDDMMAGKDLSYDFETHNTKIEVTYLGKGGYESDRKRANEILKIGQQYTLVRKEVYAWRTEFYLAEFPNESFNSVMFDPPC